MISCTHTPVPGWVNDPNYPVSSTAWHGEHVVTGAQDVAEKGQPNGYASLGADGKVPASQLPAASGGADVRSGVVNLTAGGSANVLFARAFSSTPHVVVTSQFNSADTSTTLSVHTVSVNGFTIRGAGNAAGNVAWIATNAGNS